jgi:Protein of unknown function (DUF1097)
MAERIKGLLPLAVAVGILAFLWTWFALNFSFHWVTSGDLGNGLELPASFHVILPAAFVSWAMFFAAGADDAAVQKVALANVVGVLAALLVMIGASALADLPDFWAIALGVGIAATVLVALGGLGDWYFIPGTFAAFASVFFWWIATGLDKWAPGGGGGENTVAALGDPATAGAGAFGGVLSTPYGWVAVNIFVTLMIGVLLGALSTRLAALLTPKPRAAAGAPPRGSAPA